MRTTLLFASNVILLHLMLSINSALSTWSVYMLLLGPMIVFPALLLRCQSYFICVLCTGLWVDAALPTIYGFFTILFLFAGALIFQFRIRFHAEQNYHPLLLAHLANFLFIFIVSVYSSYAHLLSFGYWLQFMIITTVSHFVLCIVAPWFFNFERMIFALFRIDFEMKEFPVSSRF